MVTGRTRQATRRRTSRHARAVLASTALVVAAGCAAGSRLPAAATAPHRSPPTTSTTGLGRAVVTASQLSRRFGVVALVRPRWAGDAELELSTDFVHWRNITPALADQGAYGGAAAICDVFFLDRGDGWVVVHHPDNSLELYRTRDGGSSWQDEGATTSGGSAAVEGVDFVDPLYGWREIIAPTAGHVSLSATADGGQTWTAVADPLRWPSEGLPAFATPDHGVIADTLPPDPSLVSAQPITSFPALQETTDGGTTWHQPAVALPPGHAVAQRYDALPTFTSPSAGVMPVVLSGPDSTSVAFYESTSGGAPWSYRSSLHLGPTAALPADRAASWLPAVAVADQHTWWVVDGIGPLAAPVVHVTADGGRSWSTVSSPFLPYPGVGPLQATSATSAWMTIQDGPGCGLYATTDGGASWRSVCPG